MRTPAAGDALARSDAWCAARAWTPPIMGRVIDAGSRSRPSRAPARLCPEICLGNECPGVRKWPVPRGRRLGFQPVGNRSLESIGAQSPEKADADI